MPTVIRAIAGAPQNCAITGLLASARARSRYRIQRTAQAMVRASRAAAASAHTTVANMCSPGTRNGRSAPAMATMPVPMIDAYPVFPGPAGEGVSPLLARLDPGHGARLLALPCDLVWATAWEHEANEVVAPWLGLPELPVVEFPPADEDDLRVGLHFKTRALVGWAAGRPFAWADDEITGTDREWVRARHPGSALLHCADPLHDLTEDDYTVLARWLSNADSASPC